ncbi:hypothetical protein RRG08_045661 [Elysia crispata]|uniref:Uncharacterized protein n=1 Tax=Elysia crispata TaxID=231223 RepID=A0AAE0YMH4_9GAST|nr:hypothetical protein RRG08_045661 [Elysia crispata]
MVTQTNLKKSTPGSTMERYVVVLSSGPGQGLLGQIKSLTPPSSSHEWPAMAADITRAAAGAGLFGVGWIGRKDKNMCKDVYMFVYALRIRSGLSATFEDPGHLESIILWRGSFWIVQSNACNDD